MYYYEVLVSSQRYHGSEPLTYSLEQQIEIGSVVEAPLGRQMVLGIVSARVPEPSFTTKPIKQVVVDTPVPQALLKLHAWMLKYYPGPAGLTSQLFLPSSLATAARTKQHYLKPSDKKVISQPTLTKQQQLVVSEISAKTGSFLLHGETGSGKTRVYIELASTTLAADRSVLVLTPEIGLTAQLAASFEAAFPGRVIIIHSTQTPAQRRDNWNLIHSANVPLVIIGPRSSLFSPVKALGLVILDEFHDAAYKQDQMPYYQASRVAAQLAHLHEAKLVLGSATPLVHDYYTFTEKKLPILRLTEAAAGQSNISIEVVNLTDREHFTKSPWLSNELIRDIQRAIQDGRQSLIFLNRRGTARVVLCKNCGWQATCPRCDLPLTYHGDTHRLQCHTCGLTDRAPVSCPDCGQAEIQFKSVGTKAIVLEVERLFPDATIARFDSDNKKSENLEANYEDVIKGEIDILVGTQMLSKGLDLPLLAVIGVVVADTSLYFPDFSADERTFQMLRQVIGRVGRGHVPGTVVLQTYHPESKVIQSAVTKNYEQFYASQLEERKLYRFPPFYFVLKIAVERSIQTTARKAAHELASTILGQGFSIELSGPAPSFLEKSHDKYRWQIIVKAKQRAELVKVINMLPKNCSYDIDPTNLL